VAVEERRRLQSGPPNLRPGGPGAPLFQDAQISRHHLVCDACAAAMAEGGGSGGLRGRRTAVQMVMFAVVLVLIAVLTPLILPYVMSALWLK
jgi:hypothetical protein